MGIKPGAKLLISADAHTACKNRSFDNDINDHKVLECRILDPLNLH
jgi:hypothetical protein